MEPALDPGEEHTKFISWAEENGVTIHGVAPARFVNRGMGIVAGKDIKKGDVLVDVPTSALVHLAMTSIKNFRLPENITVHGKMAACLAVWYSDPNHDKYKLWEKVWPTQQDFKSTMPLYWPKVFQDLLPSAASVILTSQRDKLEKDWSNLRPRIPSISRDVFEYTWFIVNTRTFFWDYPDLPKSHPRLPKRRSKFTADDCYAMCPFMDYFNHAGTGCDPTHDSKGYRITADRDYKAGEELFMSYGSHTNDFLLVEYGFMLDQNKHDSIPLDHLLIPLLSSEQVDALKEDRFYAKYTLSFEPPTTCHRTQAVLRLIVLDSKRYSAFVSGEDDGVREQARVNKYLVEILIKYSRKIMVNLEEVEGISEVKERRRSRRKSSSAVSREDLISPAPKPILIKRWKQIQIMINNAIEQLGLE